MPARIVRGIVIRGVFSPIIDTYARQVIVGDERLAHLDGPAIFVANHCSHVDTPVLLRSLPTRWRRRTVVAAATDYFYAKRVLASAVSLAFGTVPLERRARAGGGHAAAHIERLIDSGWNVVVFAEGTRSRDGRVGVMRSGAAVLAARHGVPIVPVHISGTHGAMPPGSNWMVRPEAGERRARHTIGVSFGAPIQVTTDDICLEVMESVRLFMDACGADTTPDPRLAARRATVAANAAETAWAASGQPV
jgi:1-acyl-sn-glycerol-3-phosphate acyltransferase